jgi:hypothetical protein
MESKPLLPKFYAGIGSRRTPDNVLRIMEHFGSSLSSAYVLRSGGADGADSAFERGCDSESGVKEIYLPWYNFNYKTGIVVHNKSVLDKADQIVQRLHPKYRSLSIGARKLHIRNCFQILGADLKTPVDFVLCWYPDSFPSGGTATAVNLAHRLKIPVYVLKTEADVELVRNNLHIL